jgi:hypothetical protein
MKPELILLTQDHPKANGRVPPAGEALYELRFPLDDGRELVLGLGQLGFDTMTQVLFDFLANAPSYNDGSTNLPPSE